MVSVLGKRARSINENSIPTRSKRRALINTEQQTSDIVIAQDAHDEERTPITINTCESHDSNPIDDQEQICYTSTKHLSTPQTPRHRDALSKQFPQTPRHRVLVSGRPQTPRTPRTPSTPSNAATTVFTIAKKAFARGSNPTAIVGRCNERDELHAFIEDHTTRAHGGALYVSGPPGTGKSALVTEICSKFAEDGKLTYAYINCMSIKSATDVHRMAASELGLSDDVFEANAKDILRTAATDRKRKSVMLVLLDEIDQLLSLDDDILCSLFELSLSKSSKLIVIGIANALDLTDRFLPRLKAKNIKPTLLPFLPYSAAEIATVLSARARSLLPHNSAATTDFTPFLQSTAIQLIAKKVAAQTGDMRKAFDITQRTIELVENETKEKLLKETATEQQRNPVTPSRSPLAELTNPSSAGSTAQSPIKQIQTSNMSGAYSTCLTPETAPRATLAHVARVTSAAFNNGAVSRLKGLNLQQKVILCSLLAFEQKASKGSSLPSPSTPSSRKGTKLPNNLDISSSPTIQRLFSTYSTLCRRDDVLHPLSSTEFRDVIASLETQSLVSSADAKGVSFSAHLATPSKRGRGGFANSTIDNRRVKASVAVKDVEAVIDGVGSGVLKRILCGDGLF